MVGLVTAFCMMIWRKKMVGLVAAYRMMMWKTKR